MFQDIFLFIGIPATITILNILFEKNYWDMAGISWIIVGFLKIFDVNPFLGIVAMICGILQYLYGFLIEKEHKKLVKIEGKQEKTTKTISYYLKNSLNSLKHHK